MSPGVSYTPPPQLKVNIFSNLEWNMFAFFFKFFSPCIQIIKMVESIEKEIQSLLYFYYGLSKWVTQKILFLVLIFNPCRVVFFFFLRKVSVIILRKRKRLKRRCKFISFRNKLLVCAMTFSSVRTLSDIL